MTAKKKPKLTRWFSPGINPAIRGVYLRDARGTDMHDGYDSYSHWNGKAWGMTYNSVRDAYAMRHVKSIYQNLPWRGLAENPNQEA